MTPFRVICADPPWPFKDKLLGASRGAEKNYDVLSIEDLCAMKFKGWDEPIADDALLFLWRVSSQVEEAYKVIRAWGFVPKSEIVWQKLTKNGKHHFGMGRIVRASHETCIVAQRGRPLIRSKSIRSTFAARIGEHSEKPGEFYKDIVERLSKGPYLELFARRQRSG